MHKLEAVFRLAWVSAVGILFSIHLFHQALVSVGLSDLVLAPAIAVSIGLGGWRQWWELRRDLATQWVLSFAACIVMGLIVGRLRSGHVIWWALINRGCGLVVLLGIYGLFATTPRRKVWMYLKWLVIAGSVLNVAAVVAVVFRYGFNRGSIFFFGYDSLRLSGLMHNPNAYGGYLAVLLSVQLVALAFGRGIFWRTWMDSANVAVLLLGAVFTISRGSWLAILAAALAVPFLAYAARSGVRRREQWLIPVVVAACILAPMIIAHARGVFPPLRQSGPAHATDEDSSWIYFPQGAPFYSEFLRIAGDPSGAGDRLAIMRTALQLYSASPSRWAFGLGLGNYAELARDSSLRSDAIIHNSFLWALVELGPLGAICLLGLGLTVLLRLWRSVKMRGEFSMESAAILVALLSALVWCMSNDGTYQRHLWMLLGLATALSERNASVDF